MCSTNAYQLNRLSHSRSRSLALAGGMCEGLSPLTTWRSLKDVAQVTRPLPTCTCTTYVRVDKAYNCTYASTIVADSPRASGHLCA